VSPLSASGAPFYGINYGVYGSRFYDPGLELDGTPGDGPEDMGIDCSYPSPLGSNDECEIYYTRSTDVNTGQNPNQNSPTPPEDANAFCHDNTGHCDDPINEVDELYLIDSTGTKKTIIVRKRINTTDYAIGLVRMEGRDLDQNGLVDVFSCSEEYNCSEHADPNVTLFTATGAIKLPNIQDMIDKQGSNYKFSVPRQADKIEAFVGNTAGSQFIPISPLRTSVKDLRFIINPIEDPYKAYAEKDMQSHPSVKIIMTLELSALTADKYPGEFPDITVQTTVAAGVLGKIDSYPPVEDVHVNGADSWIRSALPIDVN